MVNPEELFKKMIESAKTSKTAKSLEAINVTCSEMSGRKVSITYSSVAAFGETRGVPKAQSIRNKSGEQYRTLIDAWKSVNPYSKPIEKSNYPKSYEWIGEIKDASIRFLVEDLKTRATRLQAELDRVKSITTLEIDLRDTEYKSSSNMSLFKLTDLEVNALKSAISKKFFSSEGWSCDKYGRIKNAQDREIYKVGYVTAIEKIISSEDE